MSEKLYAGRNEEELGDYFTNHMMAMTGENLHDKSDVAAELAYRDKIIDDLRRAIVEFTYPGEVIDYNNQGSNERNYDLGIYHGTVLYARRLVKLLPPK